MSNLIKAYSIKYPETVKNLDMNERAEGYRRIYEEALEQEQKAAELTGGIKGFLGAGEPDENGFTPGIFGESISVAETENDTVSDPDGMLEIGNKKLEELMAQLDELRKQAAEIIDNANAEAAGIIENARAEGEAEKASVLKDAEEKGYAEGRKKAMEECDRIKSQLEAQIRENEENYEKQVKEMEPAFVEVLIKLLGKITGVYAEERTEVIMHVVHQALTKQTPCRNFIIRVSPKDYGTILNSKPEILLWVPEGSQIEVVEDKMLDIGDCLIETDSRIFDCGVDTQLTGIIEDIRILAATDEE